MTIDEWDEYVRSGWHGADEPHPEYDELRLEAEDSPALRGLADKWHAIRRRAALAMRDDF